MAKSPSKETAGSGKTKRKPASSKKRKLTKAQREVASAAEISLRPEDIKETSKRKRIWRWLIGKLLIVGGILAVLPILATLFYWPGFVHPVSTLMIKGWVTGEKVDRRWVDFEDIAPVAWQSVMVSEDGQYCSHSGVDWNQMNLVIDDALDGEKVRGASTIPMQSVKNLYLWSSRSYLRKILEVPLALLVDAVWSKQRLMEIYLNIAEWGPGIYGIEAASRHHFKRSAKRLNRRQAALLAVTLPNPKLRNPRKPNRGMRRLARLVERRARASGAYIGCLR